MTTHDELLERFTLIIVRTPEPDDEKILSNTMADYAAIETQKADAFAVLASDCDAASRPALAGLCRRMATEQERQARMMGGDPLPGEPPGLVEIPWWQRATMHLLFGNSFSRSFGLVDAVVYAWVGAAILSAAFGDQLSAISFFAR